MIKIVGNSGCPVEIVQDESCHTFVRKSCISKSSARLIRQIQKQENFKHDLIKSPKVLRQKIDEDRYIVEMQYVKSLDFVTFTGNSDIESYNRVSNVIVDFVKEEFERATIMKFPKTDWENKVFDVSKKISDQNKMSDSDLRKINDFLLKDLPEEILVGNCHGDLTFSNILIGENNEVFFIDFLDPPVESPYEDFAKILQDTSHLWSVHHFNGACDKAGVRIRWNYFERLLFEKVFPLIDLHTLKKIQVLSLFRIVPYTEKIDILGFLLDSISKEISIASNTTMRGRVK